MSGPPPNREGQPWPTSPPYAHTPHTPHASTPAPPWAATPGWAAAPPPLSPRLPQPWSGAKTMMVVWGWTVLLGPLVALLLSLVLIVVVGLGLSGATEEFRTSDPLAREAVRALAGAGAILAATLGLIVGFGAAFVTGLVGGAAAAGVVDRVPPWATGLIAGATGAAVAALLPLAIALGTDGSGPAAALVTAAVPVLLVWVTVGVIAWRTARRARRAATIARAARWGA